MSVATTDLGRISATDLAAAIRPRQTSRQEVIESHLRRIEAVNPSINALTVVLGEQALEAAKSANRAAVAGSGDLPPLHGALSPSERTSTSLVRHRGSPMGIGEGLPQSVQVIGTRCREDLCLDAAAALVDRAGIITPIDPK